MSKLMEHNKKTMFYMTGQDKMIGRNSKKFIERKKISCMEQRKQTPKKIRKGDKNYGRNAE